MDVVKLMGRNVRAIRRERGLTQEEFAHRAEMERSYVSDLERGTRNPSVRALAGLADALGAEPVALLRRPTKEPPAGSATAEPLGGRRALRARGLCLIGSAALVPKDFSGSRSGRRPPAARRAKGASLTH